MFKRIFNRSIQREKCVGAHLYADKIVLMAQDQVKAGYWIATKNFISLNTNVSDEEIGNQLRQIADKSRVKVKNLTSKEEFKNLNEILKKATESKTIKGAQNCKYCNVSFVNNQIEIDSTRNQGTKGHSYIDSKIVIPVDSINELIGSSIRRGWDNCI